MMVGRTFLSMTRCFKYGIDRVGIFQADRGPKSNLDSPKQVQSYFGTIPECRFGNFRRQPKFRLQVRDRLTNQVLEGLPLRFSFGRG